MSISSPPLPTLGEGWLPPGLSPPLEAWVAAGRTGWVLPLPLGVEVGTWRAPRVADATTAHTWPPEPSRLLPARPPLPSLTGPPWTGPPSPGSLRCGTRMKTTSRNSGEARAWARARRPPPLPRRPPTLEEGAWGRARGLCCSLLLPQTWPGPSWLLEGSGGRGCAELPAGMPEVSRTMAGPQFLCLPKMSS